MATNNKSSLSNSQQIVQTTEDRTEAISLLKSASSIVEHPFNDKLDLVESLSLLNDEERKIVDLSVGWFIEHEGNQFLVQSNKLHDQLIPRDSKVIRSKSTEQILRISAVKGGAI